MGWEINTRCMVPAKGLGKDRNSVMGRRTIEMHGWASRHAILEAAFLVGAKLLFNFCQQWTDSPWILPMINAANLLRLLASTFYVQENWDAVPHPPHALRKVLR